MEFCFYCVFFNLLKCAFRIILLIKGTLFWLGITCYFFGNPAVQGCLETLGFEPQALRIPSLTMNIFCPAIFCSKTQQ